MWHSLSLPRRFEKAVEEELGVACAIFRARKGGEIRLARQTPRPLRAHPSTSAALTPRSVPPRGGGRTSSDAQRILHKLRALTTDNRAIPAAARNLLFFFLRLSVLFPGFVSPTVAPSPSPSPLLLLFPDFPFFAFRLVRQGASSGTHGRHVSARVGVLRALAVTLLPPLL